METPLTNPLISVVIPHLNQPEQLRRCLDSLAAQTVSNDQVEIIVVDNGSQEVPQELCSSNSRTSLVTETIPGPGPARNKGVSVSRADVLAFIDADCTADPRWLSAICDAFAAGDADVLGGDVRISLETAGSMTALEAYESIYAYRQREYIERQNFSGTGNLAIRRHVYDTVGPFAGIEVAEDRDWGHRATMMGIEIKYVPAMIVFHPARKSFAELCAKWDRHVAHDFEEYASGPLGRLRWLGLTVAVCCSPMFEIWRIARTRRLRSFHERLLAMRAVTKIRLYRATCMISLIISGRQSAKSRDWNR